MKMLRVPSFRSYSLGEREILNLSPARESVIRALKRR
jgi:hypothetical protein